MIVIAGATACGKTRLAAEVAHRLGSCVIGADSRQVYRGLDLGSGKDLLEYRRHEPPVPYYLVDIADPVEIFSLHRYKAEVATVLGRLARDPDHGAGRRPVVLCGGSGLYIEAVLKDYDIPDVPEDEALRAELMGREKAELDAELARRDPGLHARTDRNSKKRIVRALEIARALPASRSRSPALPRPLSYRVYLVEIPRVELRQRIDRRLDERLSLGLVDEVRGLMDGGLSAARLAMLGMEYREVAAHLRGEKTHERMRADLQTAIHQLAKRQDTYFRGMERRGIPVTRIVPDAVEAVLAGVGEEAGWTEIGG